MIEDRFYLGAYWGRRDESVHDCAVRTLRLLTFLRECHPTFAYWIVARGKPVPAPKVELTLESLEKLLEPLYDDLGRLMTKAGFSMSLWNDIPNSSRGAGIHIRCGAYSDRVPPVNVCVLSFPLHDETIHELLVRSKLLNLLSGSIEAMDPDWAMLNSHKLRDSLDPFGSGQFVGVCTFLSARKFPAPSCPALPSKRIDLPDRGSIILLTEERFSVENPEHLAVAKKVTNSLRKQGVFKIMKR